MRNGQIEKSERVTRELDRILETREIPEMLRMDNGPEFIIRGAYKSGFGDPKKGCAGSFSNGL